MTRSHLPASKSTPEVIIDLSEGIFAMKGVCIPEDSIAFFSPILDDLKNQLPQVTESVVCTFDLDYFNSSSLKGIFFILKQVDEANTLGKDIKVHWVVQEDDEFMVDSAESFASLIETEIEIRPAA